MTHRVEKLVLLSEMIAFAKIGSGIKTVEYTFLLGISKQLQVSQEDFEYLFKNPVSYGSIKSQSDRVVQFHKLVLLLHHNLEITKEAVAKLHNYGFQMGLSYECTCRVLKLMESFPDRYIPTDFLIEIFKTQSN